MTRQDTAKRIVELNKSIFASGLSAVRRAIELEEQRRLWDAEFPGRPFEEIERVSRYWQH